MGRVGHSRIAASMMNPAAASLSASQFGMAENRPSSGQVFVGGPCDGVQREQDDFAAVHLLARSGLEAESGARTPRS
jgi:hypothetical protein